MIIDDGTVCALGDGRYYLTVTTSGAERLESWMLDWATPGATTSTSSTRPRRWAPLNVAGPQARELLQKLSRRPARQGELPVHPAPADHRRRRALPRDAARLRRRAGVRAALPGVAAPTISGTRILEAGREWDIRPFGLHGPAPPAAREGAHHRLAGHRLRDHAVEDRHAVGRQARQARLRRQGGAAARPEARRPRAARAVDDAGRHRLPARGLDRDDRRPARRPRHVGVGLPRARPPDRPRLGAPRPRRRRHAHRRRRRARPRCSPATPSTTRRERSSVPDLFTVHDAAKVRCFAPPEAIDALRHAGRRPARPHRARTRSCSSAPPAGPTS